MSIDPDNRIAPQPLQLEIKGSSEKYNITLPTGESHGSQVVLGGYGTYNMALTANLGFGKQVLNSTSVELTGVLSGAITNYIIDSTAETNEEPEILTYLVDTKYHDPNGLVESAILEYGVVSEQGTYAELAQFDYGEIYYQSVVIEGKDATTRIENIPNYNSEVHLRLSVYLQGQELPVILDEVVFFTPYRFLLSLYPYDVGTDYAEFMVYRNAGRQVAMQTWLDLYQNGILLKTTEVSIAENFGDYNGALVRIDELAAQTAYDVLLRAKYIDPDTKQETISETPIISIQTMPYYHWEISSFVESDTAYEIAITVEDPSHIVSMLYASLVTKNEDGSDGEYFFYQFSTIPNGDTTIYSTMIAKPVATAYVATITLYKNFANAYYAEIIYTLTV